MSQLYRRMAIVGCGLIGSSVARAARQTACVGDIAIADTDPRVRETVQALHLADAVHTTAAEAAQGADLVVIATPVGAIESVAAELARVLAPGATLTDVGSCKGAVSQALRGLDRPDVHLIPGHPIAGTEQSGPQAGFAELFRNRWTILCPVGERPEDALALDRLTKFWQALGAQVELMDPAQHDFVLAATSHLPHLVAYNLVAAVADIDASAHGEVMKFSAGGFRDFTRIAASDPIMWRDVFQLNGEAVLRVVDEFAEGLGRLREAIRTGDGATLEALFRRTRDVRSTVIAMGQESSEPNFGRDRRSGR